MTAQFPPLDESVRTTLNAAPYAVLLVDAGGRVVFENPKADRLFGGRPGALRGHPVEELMPEEYRNGHATDRIRFAGHRLRRPMNAGRDLLARRLDGTNVSVRISLSPFTAAGQPVTMAVVAAVDARRGAPSDDVLMAWIDASGELYHRLVETAPIGIYRSSPDGLLLYANPALAHLLGYDTATEIIGMSLGTEVYANPTERDWVVDALEEAATSTRLQARLRRKDGREIVARITAHAIRDASGEVVCFEGALDDVTDRLRVEADLQRMRRMESATRLAGGMSHTLSNILTSVLGNVELALEEMGSGDEAAAGDLREARDGLLRATEKLTKLRAFGAVDEIHAEAVDLTAFIVDWADHIVPGPGVVVHAHADEGPVVVEVDPAALVEVLENLVSNAVDAMPEGGRIDVTVTTSVGEGGLWAELFVADGGTGMSDITLERAMEPYYSTKARRMTSAGAGLGLSLVYGIVRQHGGDVVLTSSPDRGTSVRIRLPLKQA